MSDPTHGPVDFAGRSLRLDTLVRLRWLAVAGQTVAVVLVGLALHFPLPLALSLVPIGLSALLNVLLRLRYKASLRLTSVAASFLLAYDVLQLGALLYLTGGLDNPFAFLLLVPMIVSATTLAPRPTMVLGLVVVAVASGLGVSHLPLPWSPGQILIIPPLYSAGVFVALVATCAFTGVYTFRVAEEARQLARALNATEMVLAREQHLYALDGLAAAAAHELGTPLATIALVANELEREMEPGNPHADDIALLRSQAQRCRDILAKLASLSGEGDKVLARLPLSQLLEEVVEPYRAFAEIVIEEPKGSGPEPVGRRNPAVVQGLANLVENAVDFAKTRVGVGAEWTAAEVVVVIEDDGPGFAAGIIDRLGEPYMTTRGRTGDGRSADHEAGGLGLGLFIAKSLLERTGARLAFRNLEAPASGATVRVAWPRLLMDVAGGVGESGQGSGTTWRGDANSV